MRSYSTVEQDAAGSQPAAQAIAMLVLLYPCENFLRVLGNSSLLDLALCVVFVYLLATPRLSSCLLRIYRSHYGILSFLLICHLLLSSMCSSDQGLSIIWTVQLAFVYWVLIPCVGFCFVHLHKPERLIASFCFIYSLLYAIGFFLALQGYNLLVFDPGGQRFFPVWGEATTYRLVSLFGAFALAAYFSGRIRLRTAIACLLMIIVVLSGIASRTAFVGLLMAALGAICVRARRGQFGSVIVIVVISFFGGVLALGQYVGLANPELFSSRISTRLSTDLTLDQTRTELMRSAIQELARPKTLLLGTGLDDFHVHGSYVHNAVLQYCVEGGIPAALLILSLTLLPIFLTGTATNSSRMDMAFIIFVSQIPFLVFMPLLTIRSSYLPISFGFGLMWRALFKDLPSSHPARRSERPPA